MTDKDVKKLKRVELLEMLIEQTEENEKLRSQIAQQESKLSQREIILEKTGSIAEAALSMSGVFTQAQDAADRYLESIQKKLADTEAECERRLKEAQQQCETLERESKKKCDALENETTRRCDQLLEEAKQKADELIANAELQIRPPEPKKTEEPEEKSSGRGWLFGRRK